MVNIVDIIATNITYNIFQKLSNPNLTCDSLKNNFLWEQAINEIWEFSIDKYTSS